MTPIVPPPVATPTKIDPKTAFALLEYPIGITAPTPVLPDGTPLTVKDAASGLYLLDATIAKQTFSYGVLLYRVNPTGMVDVFDGSAWTPQAALDLSFANLKPVELAFDTKTNRWASVFVLSSVTGANAPGFTTDRATYRPSYGFITVFRSPKVTPVIAGRSSLAPTFSVIAAADTGNVKLSPVQHLTPTSDPASADGFAIFVNDGSGVPAADLVVSGDPSLPAVMLRLFAGGVVRASVSLDGGGTVNVTSSAQVTIGAPIAQIDGELRARNIRYRPFDGSPERYL